MRDVLPNQKVKSKLKRNDQNQNSPFASNICSCRDFALWHLIFLLKTSGVQKSAFYR